MTKAHIENIDRGTWRQRDGPAHKEAGKQWRDTSTVAERKRIFAQHGARWSELYRLPYWDPVLFTVIDTMHNHYLGLFEDHCRSIWGMDISVDDGNGQHPPSYVWYPRPKEAEMVAGWYYLQQEAEESLLACSAAVLYHMCLELDLRRSGQNKVVMTHELLDWVSGFLSTLQ